MLNGLLPGTEPDFVEFGLTPVLNHLGQLNAWRAAAQRFNRPLDAVIHIDTGMHRLGFSPEEAQVLANERGRLRGLRLALLMSHLVASEEPANPINGEQLSRFRNFVRTMPGAPASLANSSGIFLGPDYHFDLLRPGRGALRHQSPARPAQPDAADGDACTHASCRSVELTLSRPLDTVPHGGRPGPVAWPRSRLDMPTATSAPSSTARTCILPGTRCP